MEIARDAFAFVLLRGDEFAAYFTRFFFKATAVGDVHRNTQQQRGRAVLISLYAASAGHPAERSVRKHHAIISMIAAAVVERVLNGPAHMGSILFVHVCQ